MILVVILLVVIILQLWNNHNETFSQETNDLSFNIIVIHNMNKKHHIILRELQLWINNKNVLPVSTNNEPSLEQGGLGNRTEFIHFDTKTAVKSNSIYSHWNKTTRTFPTTNISKDLLSEIVFSRDKVSSLYIPLTKYFDMNEIQSVVLYNAGPLVGCQIEFYYNSLDNQPLLVLPIKYHNNVYRYDFPLIKNYKNFSENDSTTQIKNVKPMVVSLPMKRCEKDEEKCIETVINPQREFVYNKSFGSPYERYNNNDFEDDYNSSYYKKDTKYENDTFNVNIPYASSDLKNVLPEKLAYSYCNWYNNEPSCVFTTRNITQEQHHSLIGDWLQEKKTPQMKEAELELLNQRKENSRIYSNNQHNTKKYLQTI